jgi:hypothetical protein
MGGVELRGSCEDYFDDISYLLFVTDCRRLNTHFRPIAAPPSILAGGWRTGRRQSKGIERAAYLTTALVRHVWWYFVIY